MTGSGDFSRDRFEERVFGPVIARSEPGTYRIKVSGYLDSSWSDRLGGMEITSKAKEDDRPITTLYGELVDEAALAELLPRIDLSTVDLPALGDLLSNIDLSAIDPAALGDLLSNIDLSAVDLSALADLLAGVDWSALAEGLSDIDLSALFELLEGIDLS